MRKKHYFGVDFEAQREALLKSEAAKGYIDDVVAKADAAIEKTYEALKMSEYMEFYKSGNRSKFEQKYLERRCNASYISVALWITREEKYVMPLVDHVFYICDEFNWCVPAHAKMQEGNSLESTMKVQDLLVASTARLLTGIAVAVGELLPDYVMERIRYEFDRRVFSAYREPRDGRWARHNWSAVVPAGTLAALLHFGTREDIELILPQLYQGIETFLTGYGEDGCCIEGYNYWSYGFGHFVYFARMILEYTNGEVNYFERDKIRAIAAFAQTVYLGGGNVVSFSDGSSNFSFSIGLMSYLNELYPESIKLPDLCYGTQSGRLYYLNDLLWFNPNYKADIKQNSMYYYSDAQWYIKQGEKYSFAAKGGNNREFHNHNDVGSFMMVVGNDIPLADLGSGEYTKEYFDQDVRYTLLNTSSRGHSLPIIDGNYQLFGEEYKAANVVATEDCFSLDIEGAYEKDLVKKFHRSFYMKEDGITIEDRIEFSDKTRKVIERFVSTTKPDVLDGVIHLGTVELHFDKDRYRVSVSEEYYRTQQTLELITVYLVDITSMRDGETEFKFDILVSCEKR